MKVMRKLLTGLAALPLLAFGEWSWEMPGSVYKELDFSFRAGVDRASKIFREAEDAARRGVRVTDLVPRYRAAVAEWRKVQIQAEAENFDETLLAYATFMQAYGRHKAHDINEAIKLYEETLELHPEVLWVDVAAKWQLACAYGELGNQRKRDQEVDEFIAEQTFDGNTLMANALSSRADRYWRQGKIDDAKEDWRRILGACYRQNNWPIWNGVRETLITLALASGDISAFEGFIFEDVKPDDVKGQYEACARGVGRAWSTVLDGAYGYWNHLEKLYPKEKERKAHIEKNRRWFLAWFDQQQPIYEKSGHGIDYLFTSLSLSVRLGDDKETEKRLQKVIAYLRGEKDAGTRNSRVQSVIGMLLSAGRNDQARQMPDFMAGVLLQVWTRYDIEHRLKNYKAAEQYLKEYIERKPGAAEVKKAKWRLAELYRGPLGQIDKAIALYLELDEPPATLWCLQDCYRAAGKKKDSYRVLDELASIFESEAPRAVMTQARYREQDGEQKLAIALYRRLLSHPEWKKSGESSAAHQALERLGVATGGAMTNEVR